VRRDDTPLIADGLALAAGLCREFEGLRLKPYLCPAGVPTIGYGSTRYEDGRAVSMADPSINQERAEALLLHHLSTQCLPVVLAKVPAVDKPGRLAALLDFVFNLGAGAFNKSGLARKAAAADWVGARVEARRWIYGGGKVLPGLVRRREAEAELL
jgi:lysozyme